MTTRIFTALLSIWLFVSAFMWNHRPIEDVITIVSALLMFVLSIVSIYYNPARYVIAALAVVLLLAALFLPAGLRTTTWHNVIVAAAIFVAALVGGGPEAIRRERELYGRT